MEQRSIGGIKYEHPRQGYESVFGGWLASGDLPELVVGENTKYPLPGVWFETGAFEEVACDVLLIDLPERTVVVGASRKPNLSSGLCKAISESTCTLALRIWIVDNSGSMTTCDGQRIVETSTKHRIKMH